MGLINVVTRFHGKPPPGTAFLNHIISRSVL